MTNSAKSSSYVQEQFLNKVLIAKPNGSLVQTTVTNSSVTAYTVDPSKKKKPKLGHFRFTIVTWHIRFTWYMHFHTQNDLFRA